jgi:prepilin-type processing-associated H-X9-DG protein
MSGVLKIGALVAGVLILIGLGLSWVVGQREKASRLRCQDNLRQVGWFAVWDYTDRPAIFGGDGPKPTRLGGLTPSAGAFFPPGTLPNPNLPPEKRLSWYVVLAPHFGQEALPFDRSQAWDADANRGPVRTLVKTLVCPSAFQGAPPDEPVPTNYVGIAGLGPDAARLPAEDPRAGIFRYDGRTPVDAVRDGLAMTMVMTETAFEVGPWAAGGPPTLRGVDPAQRPHLGPGRVFGGTHPGGANVVFADGSIRFVIDKVRPDVFEAQATIAGESQPEK